MTTQTNREKQAVPPYRKKSKEHLLGGMVPANAVELEAAVLGALLLESSKVDEAILLLPQSNYFYNPAHQIIYDSIISLYNRGRHIDQLTVVEELTQKGELVLIGGPFFIVKLTKDVVKSSHIVSHCLVIKEKYLKRKMANIAVEMQQMSYDNSDVFDNIDKIEQLMTELSLSLGGGEPVSLNDTLSESLQDLSRLRDLTEDFTGIPTGSVELDDLIGGWQESDLVVLGARPGTGKTAKALGYAIAASKAGVPTAFFTMEMSRLQIGKRILSNLTNTPNDQIKLPKTMQLSHFSKIVEMAEKFLKLPIFIDDEQGLSLMVLKSKIRRLVAKRKVKLVLVDYLQLMHLPGGSFNKNDDLGEITKQLKSLAKELSITIIVLSQLSRDSSKSNRRPHPHDLRDSGAIEADADIIILLYHALELEIKENRALEKCIMANVGKHRNGRTDIIPYWVKWDTFTFSDTPFVGWISASDLGNKIEPFDKGNVF